MTTSRPTTRTPKLRLAAVVDLAMHLIRNLFTTSSQPQQSTIPQKPPAKSQKKFATLGDFSGDSHNHDDDDSDDDEDPDLYTGGEKSGLAVQNPDDLKKKILEKARK